MVVLHPGAELPGDANNNSVVTRLDYRQVSVLLSGDIEAEGAPAGRGGARIALKAAHHGSCSSTTQEFLEAVGPEVVIGDGCHWPQRYASGTGLYRHGQPSPTRAQPADRPRQDELGPLAELFTQPTPTRR
jgi:hypothetical protein